MGVSHKYFNCLNILRLNSNHKILISFSPQIPWLLFPNQDLPARSNPTLFPLWLIPSINYNFRRRGRVFLNHRNRSVALIFSWGRRRPSTISLAFHCARLRAHSRTATTAECQEWKMNSTVQKWKTPKGLKLEGDEYFESGWILERVAERFKLSFTLRLRLGKKIRLSFSFHERAYNNPKPNNNGNEKVALHNNCVGGSVNLSLVV